jgi:hypothetical protein
LGLWCSLPILEQHLSLGTGRTNRSQEISYVLSSSRAFSANRTKLDFTLLQQIHLSLENVKICLKSKIKGHTRSVNPSEVCKKSKHFFLRFSHRRCLLGVFFEPWRFPSLSLLSRNDLRTGNEGMNGIGQRTFSLSSFVRPTSFVLLDLQSR